MVKWSAVCRPKDFGGMGIMNTEVFNECLMAKWIWKNYKQSNDLWVRLLTAKYMRHGDFFRTVGKGSQFWRGLHQVKHLFKREVVHKVSNGELTNLWDDVWVTSASLRVCFPKIYGICRDVNISVAQGAEMDWQFLLRRQLGPAEREEWDDCRNCWEMWWCWEKKMRLSGA
jgi:hypothetical protein